MCWRPRLTLHKRLIKLCYIRNWWWHSYSVDKRWWIIYHSHTNCEVINSNFSHLISINNHINCSYLIQHPKWRNNNHHSNNLTSSITNKKLPLTLILLRYIIENPLELYNHWLKWCSLTINQNPNFKQILSFHQRFHIPRCC